jgi:hypothetical protein
MVTYARLHFAGITDPATTSDLRSRPAKANRRRLQRTQRAQDSHVRNPIFCCNSRWSAERDRRIGLPDIAGDLQLASNSLTRPLLPQLHEFRQRFGVKLGGAKEMDMVGHDDEAAKCPAMPRSSAPPFVDEDCCYLGTSQTRTAPERASRDEINGCSIQTRCSRRRWRCMIRCSRDR